MKKWISRCSVMLLAFSMMLSLCCQALPGSADGAGEGDVEVIAWRGTNYESITGTDFGDGSEYKPDGILFQTVLKVLKDAFNVDVQIGNDFVDGVWGKSSKEKYKAAFGSETPSIEAIGRRLWEENQNKDSEPLEIEDEWTNTVRSIIGFIRYGFSQGTIDKDINEYEAIQKKCEENDFALSYIAGTEYGNSKGKKTHGYVTVLGNRLSVKGEEEVYDVVYVFLAFTHNNKANRLVYVIKFPENNSGVEAVAPDVQEITDRNMWFADENNKNVSLRKIEDRFKPSKFWFELGDKQTGDDESVQTEDGEPKQTEDGEPGKKYKVKLSAQDIEPAQFQIDGDNKKTDEIEIGKLKPFFGSDITVSIFEGDKEIARGKLKIPDLKIIPKLEVAEDAGVDESTQASNMGETLVPKPKETPAPKQENIPEETIQDDNDTSTENPNEGANTVVTTDSEDDKQKVKHAVTYAYAGEISAGLPALPETGTYNFNDTVHVAEAPSVEGYTFSGWSAEGIDLSGDSFVMPNNDVDITGSWSVNEHQVRYAYTGTVPTDAPELVEAMVYGFGETVAIAKIPEMKGYTFGGWSTEDVDLSVDSFVMPDNDVTISGSWTINSHDVNYNYDESAPEAAQEMAGEQHNYAERVLLPAPTVEGYTFNGWTAEGIEIDENGLFEMPDEDVTVTGSWNVNRHSVRYKYTGKTPAEAPSAPQAAEYDYGETVILPAPEMEDYTFSGWSAEGTELSGDSFVMPDKDVTISGSWTINSHTLSYAYDDETAPQNTSVPENEIHEVGTKVTLAEVPADPSAYPSYTFDGWTAENEDVEIDENGQFEMPDHDVNVIGSWTRKYSVIYEYKGFKPEDVPPLPETAFYKPGESVRVADKPELEGYDFDGWKDEHENYWENFDMANDITLYGEWKIRKHTVSLIHDGDVPKDLDSPQEQNEYKYNDNVTLPKPKYEGYTFNGWKSEDSDVVVEEFTMPDSDVSFTGIWTLNSHTVRYQFSGDVPEAMQDVVLPEPHTYSYGETVSLTDAPERMSGYQFGGWNVKGVTPNEDGTFIMPDKDVMIEGTWTKDDSKNGRVTFWLILLLVCAGGFVTATIAKSRKKAYTPSVDLFSDASIQSIRNSQDRDREGESTIRRI